GRKPRMMSTALPTSYGLHVYPLARAWKMGASTWTVDKRIQFANDIDRNLMAVDGPTNGKKSDKGLDEWMPPNTAYGCEYAARYLTVARDYALSVTTSDLHSASLACGLDPEITKEK
ncbi:MULTISPECIES: HNH endonuclease family protein, partial [Rhodococcus erythropolis group]